MKRFAQILPIIGLMTVLTLAPEALAASKVGSGSFGAGVQLGYPGNGLSFNYFMASDVSIQVDATIWLKDKWTGLGVRVDLLWWQAPLARWSGADLLWYFGPGAHIFMWDWKGDGKGDNYLGLGVEFPVGIGFRFSKVPIDLNLEAVPVLSIIGNNGTDVDFGIAGVLNARYYF